MHHTFCKKQLIEVIYFFFFADFRVINPKKNGTLCEAKIHPNDEFEEETNELKICQKSSNYDLMDCYESEGSHQKTFWIYFAKRILYQISLICCYSALDGTALRQARQFNSEYAWVMVYSTIANIFCPLVAGYLIKDAPEGSDEKTDYSGAFYFFDACMGMSAIVALFLKVNFGSNPDDDTGAQI